MGAELCTRRGSSFPSKGQYPSLGLAPSSPAPPHLTRTPSGGRTGYPEGFAQLRRPQHQPSCLSTTCHPQCTGRRCSLLSCVPSESSRKRLQCRLLSSSFHPLPSSFLSLFLQVLIEHLLCAIAGAPAVNRTDKNMCPHGSSESSRGGDQITMLRNRIQNNMKTHRCEAGGGLTAVEKK